MAKFWYSYDAGDPRASSSYSLDSKTTFASGGVICAIYAGSGGEQQDGPLNGNIKIYFSMV